MDEIKPSIEKTKAFKNENPALISNIGYAQAFGAFGNAVVVLQKVWGVANAGFFSVRAFARLDQDVALGLKAIATRRRPLKGFFAYTFASAQFFLPVPRVGLGAQSAPRRACLLN